MTVQLSVVVPTCRRPMLLDRCLASLCAQAFDPARYEVIVVDDGPDLATKRVVERWRQRPALAGRGNGRSNGHAPAGRGRPGPALRYIAVEGARHGPAAARNLGWRMARGEIVAFTDDDCIPEPEWLRAGVAAFSDGVCGVAGRLIVPLSKEPTDYEHNVALLQDSQFVTANCFYRRKALAAVGGFDERFTMAWREDSDLYFTLLEHHNGNGRFEQVNGAIVVHPVRPPPWGISLRQQRQNFFNALLYKKHPAHYRRICQQTPPWHYYRIVTALLVTLIALGRGRRRVAGIASIAWLGESGRFCRQRLARTRRSPIHIIEIIITSILIPPISIFWRLWGAIKFRVLFL